MVAFAALLVTFAYLVIIPLRVVAIPPEFLLNPPGTAAFLETKNRTDIPADSIPADCQSQCTQDTLKMLTNCTASMCMCTDDTNTKSNACLDCLVTTQDSSKKISQSTRNALEAEYVNTCKLLGIRISNAKNSASRVFAGKGVAGGQAGVVGTVVFAAVLSMVV
ncbi:hypothetical protein E1B28_006062 [Marasmius oreades]|uniref:Extracellular membrane protein CFEM domain-containing protein n=1 Tax=Marasmius oreades TaxID=181124 RepID=A0A9P7S4K3_9AGAR|nr:uncharacterized protein E1B28_006062 [Marasmius oreades]KAG7095294.1 hypothetical protein E1B28_006062 [Marasmius oreades]